MYEELEEKFPSATIKLAVQLAKKEASKYPEGYYTGADFEPHIWVVAAIATGIEFGLKK